jgi:hypothetical protein
MVEFLPSKHEALGSFYTLNKKKKKRRKKEKKRKTNKNKPIIPFFSAKAIASSFVLKVRTMLDKGSALKKRKFFSKI